ncbi:MAG: MurR/RpiR family transcriptional regulator [Actinomycetia bacterium]|nr:MurR/RpiR family transcriptional regulator [Actinomycetes bacterium]
MTGPRSTDARVDVALRGLLGSLPPAEARVAEVFLGAVEAQTNPRVAEVARQARASTASVVRVYQRLGYERFSDFWVDLALSSRGVSPDEPTPLAGRLDRDDSLADVVASLCATERLSLADTAAALDLDQLGAAVELLAGAARVDLFGVGASALVAADLCQKLTRIGLCALQTESTHGAWTALAAAGPGTVLVAVSHSGETRDLVDLARIATGSGVPVVLITNAAASTLAAQADAVLTTAAREVPFRTGALASRTAQMLVVDCLFTGVALATYDRSMAALKRTFAAIEETESARTVRSSRRRRREEQ